jgi:ribosome-associated protein
MFMVNIMGSTLNITDTLSIDSGELIFTASRSSGPGGQNVNKVNTRVTLWFDVANTGSLTEKQKELITKRLSTRINKNGQLRVASQKYRTQAANRKAAIERLVGLLQDALQEVTIRKKVETPKAVNERRLQDKKHRSRVKAGRSKINE